MYTVFNEDEGKFQLVEEPDASLSYTYADYLKWRFEERVELIRGRIFKMSSATNLKHQLISGKVFLHIARLLEGKKCKVFSAPFDVRLPVKNSRKDDEITIVVQPDLCVICDPSRLDERGCTGAPDLVIEILSPGNTQKEIRIKHQLYEEAGVKEYWIIYPVEESIAVFVLDSDARYSGARLYAAGDIIESKAVEGFNDTCK